MPVWRHALTVEDRLYQALAVLRLVVMVNAVALDVYRFDNVVRPLLGALCVAVIVVWTALAVVAYADPVRRTPLLLGLDLALAVALLLASPLVKGADFDASVPGFWVMGALLAWSVRYQVAGGLVAGVVLAASDLLTRDHLTQANYGNAFLLVIGGPIVGYMCGSLQRMSRARDVAERAAAADAERTRLARAVHDGVLQVLALVQRRSAELGGDGAELGRLAGEQEAALRSLIREQDAVTTSGLDTSSEADLAALLARLDTRPGVTVATPGTPVLVPASTAAEVVAVVGACLDNVARHVGEGAPAWVLLQAGATELEVSVRDEGPGIAVGRLDEAVAQGRLGVSESICGRVRDLGGTAELSSGPHGTEWELVVPRRTRR